MVLMDSGINRMAREEALGVLTGPCGLSVSWQHALGFLEAESKNVGCKKPKSPSIVHKRTHMGLSGQVLSVKWLGEGAQLRKPAGSNG